MSHSEGLSRCHNAPQQTLYGKDSIRILFKEGAVILGLPSDYQPHSLRGAYITKLVNDPGVSIAETMVVAHHSSVSVSKNYQQVAGVSEANRLHALGLIQNVPEPSKPSKTASTVASAQILTSPCSSVSSTSSNPRLNDSMVEIDEWGDPLDDGTDFVLSHKSSSPSYIPCAQVCIEELKAEVA